MLRNRLKSIRYRHEMNQVEFATFLGVAKGTYNTWERERRQPSLSMALVIADKLRCDVKEIFYLE